MVAEAPAVRLFGVTLQKPPRSEGPSATPSGASGDSSGGAATGGQKRGAAAVDSPKPGAADTKRLRLEAPGHSPTKDRASGCVGYGTAWLPPHPAKALPGELPPLAESLAVARTAGDAPKQRGSPGSTCGRSSLNSGSSTFSVSADVTASAPPAALHRVASLPRPVATHATAAPTPVTAAPAAPHPAMAAAAAGNTLRLSAATAFAPYAAPAAAHHPVPQPVAALHQQLQAAAAAAGGNPFAGDAGSPFAQPAPPVVHPVAVRPARRPSSKSASLDSHASSDMLPPAGLEGAASTLDGKTAAERRRETLAIQATLPPDLKICSSCRQIKSRDQYHACRAKKDQLQDRCKVCRASLDAVRTALARPANAAARPVGALALERAARSSEPFMRDAAAAITQSGRASCRRASEPVAPQPPPGGRIARRGSTPAAGRAASMQSALDSIREDPAGQMYQAAAAMPPPPWGGAQQARRHMPPPPPFQHRAPQQPRSRLGGYPQPPQPVLRMVPPAAPPAPALQSSQARWTLAALVCLSAAGAQQAGGGGQLSMGALAAALGVSSAAGLLLAAAAACGLTRR